MKRTILTSLFIALVMSVFSQEMRNDTVVVDGNNVEILIKNNKVKVTDSENGLKINVFSVNKDGQT